MLIDSFTVLLFGLLIKLVLGALFVAFWLKNRAAPWFGWWSVSLLFGSVTSVLYMWRGPDSLISVGIGNATLIVSFACCWQGARAFDRRPTAVEPRVAAGTVVARRLSCSGIQERACLIGSCSRPP